MFPRWLALSSASVTLSRPCHVSSPCLVERSMRISRTALLQVCFASRIMPPDPAADCPCHRAVASTPPSVGAASIRFRLPCCLRPPVRGLGLRGYSLPRPLLRSTPSLRPGAPPPPRRETLSIGFRASGFPATLLSKVRGFRLLPRQAFPLLNMPAFAGHTTGRADFRHPGFRLASAQSPPEEGHRLMRAFVNVEAARSPGDPQLALDR